MRIVIVKINKLDRIVSILFIKLYFRYILGEYF